MAGETLFAANTVLTAEHARLAEGEAHSAAVTVRDAAGNPLLEAFEWSFEVETGAYRIYLPAVAR